MGDWTTDDCKSARQRYKNARTLVFFAETELSVATDNLVDAKKVGADVDKAQQKVDAAQQRYDTALKNLDAAKARVTKACGERMVEYPNGAKIVFSPFVADDDADLQKVVKKISSLPKQEVGGVKVTIDSDVGPGMTYTSPNLPAGENTVKGVETGRYKDGEIILHHNGYKEEVAKHEVGHFVFDKKLNDKDREKWRHFWDGWGENGRQNKIVAPKGNMPTDYAGTNEREAFAEVYEFYRDRKTLAPEVEDLIKGLLGGIV